MKMNKDYEDEYRDKQDELEALGIDTAAGESEHKLAVFLQDLTGMVPNEDKVTAQRIAVTLAKLSVLTSARFSLDADLVLQEVSADIPFLLNGKPAPELVPRPPRVEDHMTDDEIRKTAEPIVDAATGLELAGVHPQHLAFILLRTAAEILVRHIGDARTVSIMIGQFGKVLDAYLQKPLAYSKN